MKEAFAQVEKTKSRLLGSKGFSVQLKYPGGVILTEGKASSVRYIWAKNAEPAVGLRITWKPFTNTVCRDVSVLSEDRRYCVSLCRLTETLKLQRWELKYPTQSVMVPESKIQSFEFCLISRFFLLHFQVVVSHRFLFLVSVYPYSWSFMLRFQVWSSLCVLSCISLCQVTYNSSVFLRYCCL